MDQDAKKTALRMIPYGIYVLTADDGKGNVAAATVNWVTQTAFAPPLVVVGVKTDSGAYQIVKNTKAFALNMLGKDQKGAAFTFFKPTTLEGGKLSGQAIHKGTTGAPILDAAPAAVECRVTSIVGARRPPHRRRRGRRRASAKADHRASGRRDPRDERTR
jgi:flavin reductase (DIM6/NTAB) family NADH-FMN oxidoreductase RutF